MTDLRITAGWVTLAIVAVLAVVLTSPRARGPADSASLGQVLFPQFTDLAQVGSLDVVAFDAGAAVVRPIVVRRRGERWTLQSHHDYPADGHGLGTTAASLIGLRTVELASDDVADHERLGVLDPLDETLPTSQGRGVRITARGEGGEVLTDIIVGGPLDDRPDYRYVRLPQQRRTYVASMAGFKVSTSLADWIEPRLLSVDRDEIDGIVISAYVASGVSGVVSQGPPTVLRHDGHQWLLGGGTDRPQPYAINLLMTRLLALSIVDVRPKFEELAASLAAGGGVRMTKEDAVDLASKGFFLSTDGRLIAGFGEAVVHTRSGAYFAVRFGGIVNGTARYVMVTPGWEPAATRAPASALADLRARFAPWYFVVEESAVSAVKMTRPDLLRPSAP